MVIKEQLTTLLMLKCLIIKRQKICIQKQKIKQWEIFFEDETLMTKKNTYGKEN